MDASEGTSLAPAVASRRSFLDAVLGLGFVSTAVAAVYPIWCYLVPPPTAEPATASVVACRLADLPPNSGLVFKLGTIPGIVLRTPAGDLEAFSAVCPHLGCTVQYKRDTSQIWCACHNGVFDLGGNVVSGPPPRPLERLTVNVRGEPGQEDVIVSRGGPP